MSTEEPTNTEEPPEPKWGDPISEERQAELKARLDAWDALGADHGDKKGPFYQVWLSGADASWLVERSGRDEFGRVPNLHLEGAYLLWAHLVGATLQQAQLEEANLRAAHLEGADLGFAHLEGADLEAAYLEGVALREAHLERADLHGAHLERADLRGVRLNSETAFTEAILDRSTYLVHDQLALSRTGSGSVRCGSCGQP